MQSSAELVCVPPERVNEFWPHAKHLIRQAIERTDLTPFEDIEDAVLRGNQILWLAWSGVIEAAATTHLTNRTLVVTACGGWQRDRWLSLFGKIEQYAADEGCKRIRIFGRKGWERILTGYRPEYVILERQL